jgi:carbon monoxide dehydrogenase subunit G
VATHVERSIEVAVPVRTAYDQWTQFEEFPRFMDGVQEVRQIGDALTHWVAEIGGVRREWDAAILEQIPDQKVAWAATTGATNAGAVFFQAVGEDRTMVRLTLDYEPEGLVERIADFFDVIDRQAVADLDRFKEYIESAGSATGGWRGRVDEGDVISTGSAGLGAAGVGVATAGLAGGAGPAATPPMQVDRNAGVGAAGLATGGPSADEAAGDVVAVGTSSPLATGTGAGSAPATHGGADAAPGAARTVDDGPGADDVQGDALADGTSGGTPVTGPGRPQVSATAGTDVGTEVGDDPVVFNPRHPLPGAGDVGTGGPTADAARASSGVASSGTDTGLSSEDQASGAMTGSPASAASGPGSASTGSASAGASAVDELGPAADPHRPITGMGGAR